MFMWSYQCVTGGGVQLRKLGWLEKGRRLTSSSGGPPAGSGPKGVEPGAKKKLKPKKKPKNLPLMQRNPLFDPKFTRTPLPDPFRPFFLRL